MSSSSYFETALTLCFITFEREYISVQLNLWGIHSQWLILKSYLCVDSIFQEAVKVSPGALSNQKKKMALYNFHKGIFNKTTLPSKNDLNSVV